MNVKFALILSAFLASACATTTPTDLSGVSLSTDFEAGRADTMTRTPTGFTVALSPEDTPINDSPWYAFDILGARGETVPITLSYTGGTHRYAPKIRAADGQWETLNTTVDISEDETKATFSVTPQADTIRIAAQPIIDTADHAAWTADMAAFDFVVQSTIGQSVENRPLLMLEEVDAPDVEKPYVVLIGRQHPPEVTGAQALQPFVETIWADTELAKKFRAEFNLIVIPLVNPDGVARGNWRHNVGGLDLNRDWGPFTQPETQAMKRVLDRFKSGEDEIALFLDFHSTWRNLIYTQTDAEPTTPAFFTRDWINAVKAVLPEEVYSFTREANKTSDRPVSKNYMYRTYGIPAMTFEVGDDTPRDATETASRIFAEQMMIRLLMSRGLETPK